MPQTIDTKAILAELGEGYADSKLLEGVTDSTTLAKRFMDTKASHDARLGDVIQKPASDATDEQKAEYESVLKKELGAAESVDDYVFPDTGVERSEELSAFIKQTYLDEGLSPAVVNRMMTKFDANAVEAKKTAEALAEQAYQDDVKAYKAEHVGNSAIVSPRIALKAMLQFGKANPEMAKAIIDSKVLNTPGDFAALRKIGITPAQLRMWEPIADAMKSDTVITNEGKPTSTVDDGPEPGSREAKVAARYNHPTSVAARKARGEKH